jgi:hypothetical protein
LVAALSTTGMTFKVKGAAPAFVKIERKFQLGC